MDVRDPDFSFGSHGGFEQTSDATTEYNCIAWAAGVSDAWWWPDSMCEDYWPSNVPREDTLEAFITAFGTLGYSVCDSSKLESGYEKVALFESADGPQHAARQIVSGEYRGKWTSKMGNDVDIVHDLLAVSGILYGQVKVVLKRPIDTSLPPRT